MLSCGATFFAAVSAMWRSFAELNEVSAAPLIRVPLRTVLSLLCLSQLQLPISVAGEPERTASGQRTEPSVIRTFDTTGRVDSLTFDSTGKHLVSVGWSNPKDRKNVMPEWNAGTSPGDIRIWDVATGAQIAKFGEDVGGMFDVATSPDETKIVAAGRGLNSPRLGAVRIWDLKSHKSIRTLGNHKNWVLSIA